MLNGVLFGLTGPSGVGKGFIKKYLKSVFPDSVELSIVTTRKRRPTDGIDRETDIPIALFFQRKEIGEIIFAHQPFGETGDWYGFQKMQILDHLEAGHFILTEVHVDNVQLFHTNFPDNTILFGLVADTSYLRDNLLRRNTESLEGQEIRLRQAMEETEKIRALHASGILTDLIPVSYENRLFVPALVGEKVTHVLQERMQRGCACKERG